MAVVRLTFIAAVVGAIGVAASLERVSQIAVSDYVRLATSSLASQLRVTAMEFSPDEQWIATTVSESGASATTTLIVISRERQANSLKFTGRIPPVRRTERAFGRISWSPSGDMVTVGSEKPVVVRLSDEKFCTLDSGTNAATLGGFASPTDVVTAERAGDRWQLVSYGPECKPKLHRELAAAVTSLDTSAAASRILIATADNHVRIYDAATGKVVKDWGRTSNAQYRFLAGGTTICSAGAPSKSQESPSCWSIADDQNIRGPEVWGGAPFAVSDASNAAAFTDGKYIYDAFFEMGKQRVRGGVLWDFSNNKVTTRWRPEVHPCSAFELVRECDTAAVFALSPRANYFAEFRAGEIRVYRIKPK